jgi:GPH family glycoside/pentoside/hexuronide:cation symporter
LEHSGYNGALTVQPPAAIEAIRWSIGPLPTVFLILGVILAYFYPITQSYHEEILLKLAERKREA